MKRAEKNRKHMEVNRATNKRGKKDTRKNADGRMQAREGRGGMRGTTPEEKQRMQDYVKMRDRGD